MLNSSYCSKKLNITVRDDKTLVCTDFPPTIHSSGVWGDKENASLPVLQTQMGLIFFLTQILHLILRRFGISVFVSQMLAGLILGPGVLGNITCFRSLMYGVESQDTLGVLTMFAYSMFLFLVGVKMDLSIVFRTGRKALYTGICALLVPLSLTLITLKILYRHTDDVHPREITNLVFSAITYSQTAFPVVACLLGELKLLTSELGRLGLSSAICSDMLSLFLRVFTQVGFKVKDPTSSPYTILKTLSLLGYLLAVVFLARPAMYWIIKQTPKGKPVHSGYLFIIMLAALCSALFSSWFSQYFFLGPFILGLAVPDGPPLGSTLVQKYDFMVSDVLVPVFVTSHVMLMNPTVTLFDSKAGKAAGIMILVSLVTKLGGTLACALCCKMPLNDAFVLALIMSCKGIVEFGSFTTAATGASRLDNDVYTSSILAILINACVVPLLIKHLYKPSRKYAGYQQRNIASLRPNSELRILACIHRQENISAVINFLDVCSPTKDSPMSLYVLHLIKMFGQAVPVFISHRMQKKTISNCSYSEEVLLSFLHFERDFREAFTVHPFTSVCPPDSMNEEICIMSLDRLTSLIILPFHRHWTLDGSIKSEDQTIRSLNISVLERAPCSVGILVNRGPLRKLAQGNEYSSSQALQYKVALIFLGGQDDREALALSQRMAADPSISLTVYHLTTSGGSDIPNWETILDMESLRRFRENYVSDHDDDDGYASYTEQIAENGPHTVEILRSIMNQYDLFIVGRRQHIESPQTAGLDEWSEFPELGIVGDILASDDFMCRSSIFVVQNQHTT